MKTTAWHGELTLGDIFQDSDVVSTHQRVHEQARVLIRETAAEIIGVWWKRKHKRKLSSLQVSSSLLGKTQTRDVTQLSQI